PLPGGLEPLGKRRKESGRRRRPARAELAGASESLGRGDGERKYQSVYRGNKSYFTALRRALRRDFLRDAIDLWITPVFAALSKAELTAFNVAAASSFLPDVSSATYFF